MCVKVEMISGIEETGKTLKGAVPEMQKTYTRLHFEPDGNLLNLSVEPLLEVVV